VGREGGERRWGGKAEFLAAVFAETGDVRVKEGRRIILETCKGEGGRKVGYQGPEGKVWNLLCGGEVGRAVEVVNGLRGRGIKRRCAGILIHVANDTRVNAEVRAGCLVGLARIRDDAAALRAIKLAAGMMRREGDREGRGAGAKILGFRVLQVAGTTHERYAGKFAEAVNAWREENRDVNKVGEEEELKIAIAVGVAETARQCPWRVMEVSE
jgi:hypothetical protein